MEKQKIPSQDLTRDSLNHLGFQQLEYFQSETSNDELLKQLDRCSGIDGFLKDKDNCIYTLATRNRFIHPDKQTVYPEFTIRGDLYSDVKSEFTKRINSINNGSLFPYYTLQSWFSGSTFLCAALTKTQDLYHFIKTQPKAVFQGFSDRRFYCVKWDDLKSCDYSITIATSSFYQL